MELEGQVAIVTAGGSVGIGRAVCLALAQRGATVIVTDRSGTRAVKVSAEIEATGGTSVGREMDVTRRDQVETVIQGVVAQFGRIDVLVNNAGVSIPCPVTTMTDETWDIVLNVNLRGMFWCTRAVLPTMIARRYGRIINLSSYVAFAGSEELAHYAAAKAGVLGFTKSLAREVGRYNILVNAVAPGIILNEHLEKNRAQFSKSIVDELERGTPLGRQGSPEDVAEAIVFLATQAARFITGGTIPLTGGLYMI